MQQMKREASETIENSNFDNKKQKLQTETSTIHVERSCLEDLSNEIFYEIFEYVDMYDIYQGFYHLNNRFKSLIIHLNLPMHINISAISISKYNDVRDIVSKNKNRISAIRLSNPFVAEVMFCPLNKILTFSRLRSLILEKITPEYLVKLCSRLSSLPNFHALIISIGGYVDCLFSIFLRVSRLSKLKYFKITYETKPNKMLFSLVSGFLRCRIEYLIINGRYPFSEIRDLLRHLPQLRYLSIKTVVKEKYSFEPNVSSPFQLKHLKFVSLELDSIRFDRLEKLIKQFFYYVKSLRLTTYYHEEYINAERWEQLIVSSMPYLQLFDFYHHGSVNMDMLTFHNAIAQFDSSFWIDKQWFFTHHHARDFDKCYGVFYSTNHYRRKDFIVDYGLDQQLCSNVKWMQWNSVEHVHTDSRIIMNNDCLNYFPNAKKLTIKYHFTTTDMPILATLDRIIPLKQLTKLIINDWNFPFVEIIPLLRVMSNLHTLKLPHLSSWRIRYKSIEENEDYQYILTTNKIQHLTIDRCDSYEMIKWIVKLFPKLQYFQSGINRKEIVPIVRYLLRKHENKLANLFLMCITKIPQICLREVKVLIITEKLLDDYFIKFIDGDMYLWW